MATRRRAADLKQAQRQGAFDYEGALDVICDRIESGDTMRAIAESHGVHRCILTRWVQADAERTARVMAARTMSAETLAEEADTGIATSKDMFELRRAEARAHHLRWLAKMRDPKRFSDRLVNEHTGEGGGPVVIAATTLDERL